MTVPFRTKVCGVTQLADLQVLADAGIDAVGLNFVSTSPRCITPVQGHVLAVEARRLGLKSVAVVMNFEIAELQELLASVQVDFVQFHGTELPNVADSLPNFSVIKAVSWSGRAEELQLVLQWNASAAARSGQLAAFLVDAFAPGVGGGTGRIARWDLLNPRSACFGKIPLILAGGLSPQNVAAAIQATQCEGVDTASGVETQPGKKDAHRVQQFAAAAKAAFRSRT